VRILVTNDDGIESEGIHVLARALATTEHDIVVVAPDRNWSGAGAAIGDLDPGHPLPVRRVEIPDATGVEAWALAGPPALTVIASRLGAFGDPPDLVVSGINAGLNTGRSVLHSGTVGAALAGQNFGLSGLAVSVAWAEPWRWDTAAALALQVLELVIAAPPRSVLNLNVPSVPLDEVKGIRWARIAPYGAVRATINASSDTELEFVLAPTGFEPGPDTDQGCVDRGYASLTTVVGIVEAWPETPRDGESSPDGYRPMIIPGAELHPVHEVPDATDHRLLRRPDVDIGFAG
jgi:5'-nucleotidase